MSGVLLKALAALLPVCALLVGSILLFCRAKSFFSFLQVFGAGCLLLGVVTHVCEALRLFPSMRWGHQGSPGHYVDFWSVALGLTLFPLGYLFHALAMKPTAPLRKKLSVFATTPSTSSRFPTSLVRFAFSRSRTPAVLLFSDSRGLSLSR